MQKHILEFNKKMEMFLKSMLPIESYLKSLLDNNKLNEFETKKIQDALFSIKTIKENGEIQYKEAFFYSFSLAKEFHLLSQQIKNNQISINELSDESYWEQGNISFPVALFFSYSFVSELFGQNIAIDMHKIADKIAKSKNVEKAYKDFIDNNF